MQLKVFITLAQRAFVRPSDIKVVKEKKNEKR